MKSLVTFWRPRRSRHAAVPVAADHGDPQAVGDGLREQRHHHDVEGIDLDEERDVLVEQRVGRVPRRGVAPHQVGLPAGGGTAGRPRSPGRPRRSSTMSSATLAVRTCGRSSGSCRRPARSGSGDRMRRTATIVRPLTSAGDHAEDAEQQDLRLDRRLVDRAVVHRVEPHLRGGDRTATRNSSQRTTTAAAHGDQANGPAPEGAASVRPPTEDPAVTSFAKAPAVAGLDGVRVGENTRVSSGLIAVLGRRLGERLGRVALRRRRRRRWRRRRGRSCRPRARWRGCRSRG